MLKSLRTVLCCAPLAMLVGCNSYRAPAPTSTALTVDRATISTTPTRGPIDGRSTLGMPMPVPGQQTCVVPYAVMGEKGMLERDDPYVRGGVQEVARASSGFVEGTRTYGASVRWHNAVVRDLANGDQWPILDRRGVIERWFVFGRSESDKTGFVSRALVFIATIDDSNRDGMMDNRDNRVAILTDGAGRRPRIVTPPDRQVWNVSYDPTSDAIYFLVAQDTTREGSTIGTRDEAVPYVLRLSDPGPAQPVVSDATRFAIERFTR
jgi:hypothetical protein